MDIPDEDLLRLARELSPRLEHLGLMLRGHEPELSMVTRQAGGLLSALSERLAKLKEHAT